MNNEEVVVFELVLAVGRKLTSVFGYVLKTTDYKDISCEG